MTSIIKKIKKGKPYYYAVESKRVSGKPRIVWQKYLGTVESIVARSVAVTPPKPKETVIVEAGGVAALLGIAQRLNLLELINEQVPLRGQGPNVGHYLILAALNCALSFCTKMAIGDWYDQTVLPRLWSFPKSTFNSQRFWDLMNRISDEDIQKIEDRILTQVKAEFGLNPNVLVYDAAHFFSFFDTSNDRDDLHQDDHSQAGENDLRLAGISLLVTQDFQIPLLHRTYNCNIGNLTQFLRQSQELINKYQKITGGPVEAVSVYDKENVSDEIMKILTINGVPFVAALSTDRLQELVVEAEENFEERPDFPGIKVIKKQVEVWGKTCQGVVIYAENLFTRQLADVTQNMVKCQKRLLELSKRLTMSYLEKERDNNPTVKGVKMAVKEILKPQFMKDIFNVQIEEKNGLSHIKFSIDHSALHHLTNTRLGRTVLITDKIDWSPFFVVRAYRSLAGIEDTLKNMKSICSLRRHPEKKWTNQKLKIHGLYCFLALLLTSIARKEVIEAGMEFTLPALLAELINIREVAVIYPPGTLAHRKDHIALTRMTPRQRKLAETLRVAEILAGN